MSNYLYRCRTCRRHYTKKPFNGCSCFSIDFDYVLIDFPVKVLGYVDDNVSGLTAEEIYEFDKNCDQPEDYTEEIDNSCDFKHCKHFGKNPVYEPCSFCNLRRDLRNCYQEEE